MVAGILLFGGSEARREFLFPKIEMKSKWSADRRDFQEQAAVSEGRPIGRAQ